jgi:hypothetical protein
MAHMHALWPKLPRQTPRKGTQRMLGRVERREQRIGLDARRRAREDERRRVRRPRLEGRRLQQQREQRVREDDGAVAFSISSDPKPASSLQSDRVGSGVVRRGRLEKGFSQEAPRGVEDGSLNAFSK